jgi:hypothetical protein
LLGRAGVVGERNKRPAGAVAMAPENMAVDPRHALIGTWVQESNSVHTTTVVYRIAIESGRVRVEGVDESDGIELRISASTWDGEVLRFVSLFPPTRHKASHEFKLIGKGRARHETSYSDEDGEHIVEEVWTKVS